MHYGVRYEVRYGVLYGVPYGERYGVRYGEKGHQIFMKLIYVMAKVYTLSAIEAGLCWVIGTFLYLARAA